MVSGLVTSPWDHANISSGDARRSAMDSKSLMCVSPEISVSRSASVVGVVVVVGVAMGWGERRLPRTDTLTPEASAGFRDGLVRIRLRAAAPAAEHNVQRKTFEFVHEHMEGRRDIRAFDLLARNDGLVRCRATVHVVRLDGEHFLERVRSAVSLERPHLHLAEALAAELRFAPERLLGNERVGADGAHVDLILHEMIQLHNVGDADRDFLTELLAGEPVVEVHFSVPGEVRLFELRLDLGLGRASEGWRNGLVVEQFRRHAKVRLEDLAEVHARCDTEWIQDNIHGPTVGEERHVLVREDTRDNAFVPVAPGELVADGYLPELRHFHLHLLDDPG